MNITTQGLTEAIDQALQILEFIDSQQYKQVAKPILDYSIGSHFRHNLDLFIAVRSGLETGIIDYDIRRRGHIVESDISVAIKEHISLKEWAKTITEQDLEKEVLIRSEALLSDKKTVETKSTIIRELLFSASHAVHHYALITAALRFSGVEIDKNIGYAPATASFLRTKK